MTGRRAAAAGALAVGALTIAWALFLLVRRWPVDVVGPALLIVAALCAWWGIRRRGARRTVALGLAALLMIGALIEIAGRAVLVQDLVTVAGALVVLALARHAYAVRIPLPRADPPSRPVLFINPRSGDGRAERTGLAGGARERGIEVVTLEPGDDLNVLVADAVERGADALAMAGGDGSQAIVAADRRRARPAVRCIPAGTRNHFALDLGVDRDDVVGALDAFVDGGERRRRPGRGQRARRSSTTSRSGSTPRRSSARATATRSCARCSTPSRTSLGPDGERRSTCAGRAGRHEHHRPP